MNQWFFHTIFNPQADLVTTYGWWTYLLVAILIVFGGMVFASGLKWINRKSPYRGGRQASPSKATASMYMYPLTGLFIALAGVALAWGAFGYRFELQVNNTGIVLQEGSSRTAGQWDSLWDVQHDKVGTTDEIIFMDFFRGDKLTLSSSDERLGSYFPRIRDAILQRTDRIDLKAQREHLRSSFHR